MNGFVEDDLPPAPEVGPENAFDVQLFTNQVVDELKKAALPAVSDDAFADAFVKAVLRLLAFIQKWSLPGIMTGLPFTDDAADTLQRIATLLGTMLVKFAGAALQPGMEILGALSQVYVQQFVDGQSHITPGQPGQPPSGLKPAAAGLFDAILAPLAGIAAAHNPRTIGAGEANSQFALGSIVAMHLNTWMINILSNVTGLGALRFINSFDDVMTGAVSARGLSRTALKPYLAKFMTEPLQRDLDFRLPLDIGSVAALVKRYIRGNMTPEELKFALRGRGYDDEVVADLLLDSAKLFSVDDLLWMIDEGIYTFEEAVESLKQQGYLEEVARVKLRKPAGDLVASQMRSLAASLVSAFIDRRIENPELRYLLRQAGFAEEEVEAMVARGAILQELPTRLSRSDVVQLFNEGLVDLNRVLEFLHEEGYSDNDADLLALLYFTRKEERDQRRAELAERRRIQEEARIRREQEQLTAQQAALLGLS